MKNPILFNKLLLIQSVQARPAIWDKGLADYNCKEIRKERWIEICRIMIEGYDDLSALEKEKYSQDCQKYWKKIRDSYRRSLNLRKDGKCGSRAKNKPIKYEKELEFLKQYIEQEIPQVSNLDDSSAHSINDDSQPTEPSYQANSPVSQPGSVSRYPSETLKNSQQPREPQEPRDTTSEILSRYLQTKKEEDSTDYFFKSMASKVKGMPNKMKAEIERKIFQIVNAAELKLSEQEELKLLYSSRGQSVMTHTPSSVGNDHTKTINAPFAHYQTGKNNNPVNKYETYTPSNCSDETDITDPLSNFEIRRNKKCTDKNKTYTRSKRVSRSLPYTYTPSSVRNDKTYALFTNYESNDDMFTPSP